MAHDDDDLGGRLALLRPAELDADQAALYRKLADHLLPWAKQSGFVAQTADGRLVGPFNPLLLSPKLGSAFVDYLAAERDHTTLPARTREVVILTVGAVWQSAYELYAHAAVAGRAGLDPTTVQELAAGGAVGGLTDAERAAHNLARELAADRAVSDATYRHGVDLLGDRGVADVIHLAGLYMATSAMLNAFAVPVPKSV